MGFLPYLLCKDSQFVFCSRDQISVITNIVAFDAVFLERRWVGYRVENTTKHEIVFKHVYMVVQQKCVLDLVFISWFCWPLYIVCPSSIYGFLLHLWFLHTFLSMWPILTILYQFFSNNQISLIFSN